LDGCLPRSSNSSDYVAPTLPVLQAKRTWPGLAAASTDQTLDWLIRAVRKFENASIEDPIAVADSHGANATFTPRGKSTSLRQRPRTSRQSSRASLPICASAASRKAREATDAALGGIY